MKTPIPPSPFVDQGKRSTFEDLLPAAKNILEEIVLPVFIDDPSKEYLETLVEKAA